MDNALTEQDLPDIQGLVINGYSHLPYTRYVFLKIGQAASARVWLRALLPSIRTAARRTPGEPRPETSLNIAVSFAGLQALGMSSSTLAAFPQEFQQGMTNAEVPRVLGDTGESSPDGWDFGGPNTPRIDVLLMIFGTNADIVASVFQKLAVEWTAAGLEVVYSQDTGRISEHEPFGFRDGISQPIIAGSPGSKAAGETPINAGDFLLGYLNGYGTAGSSPLLAPAADPDGILPAAQNDPATKDFGRNGTYVVFRKLAQDVDGLWSYLDDQSAKFGHAGDRDYRDWLGAKLVGRWKDGTPLVLSPDRQPETGGGPLNDFLYMGQDADGLRCPVGAHIRRTNPRDSLPPNPSRSMVIANRHRLIRRGRHYEDSRNDAWPSGDVERGLCFVALNADIQRQFEFVQQTWINSPKFNGLYDNKDPLIGDNDGTFNMSIPRDPVRQRLCGLPRFTRVRGGGYFLMPGMRALRFLASVEVAGPAVTSPLQTSPSASTANTGGTMATLHALWQDVLKDKAVIATDFTNLRESISKHIENLLAQPHLILPIFQFLREHDPNFLLGDLAIVSRYPDVLETLTRNADFSVTEIYMKKMQETTGSFVLGMADTPQYQRERELMQRALKADDIARITEFVTETAGRFVSEGLSRGRIDVVSDLSRLVPARLVGWYFGTPGPDDATLMRWMRAIFRQIFLNLGNDPGMQAEGESAAQEMNAYLNGLIAQRKVDIAANPDRYDDYLSRLIKIGLEDPTVDDDTIRRIIGGIIVGAVDTNSKAITQAVDQLLDRPEILADAQRAARAGDPSFSQYVFEALRFNPQNPFLIRYCEAPSTIAAGTGRERAIPHGALVIIGTWSAMFDADKVKEPNDFRLDRPADEYIHFGYGQHTCFGRHIAGVLIPEVARQLLSVPSVRRVGGVEGQIRYDGAFPDHLLVELGS